MSIDKCTPGKWEPIFLDKVCIGVGIELEPGYNMMVCNSMLPDSDAEYKKEKKTIEADMKIMAASKKMYDALVTAVSFLKIHELDNTVMARMIDEALPKL